MKVIDKIAAADDGSVVYSFEFFTPKPRANVTSKAALTDTFISTVTQMASHGPSFCDITWRPTDTYPPITLDLAARMQNSLNIDTMLHLTCVNMPIAQLDDALDTARSLGVHNIVALRGDIPPNHTPHPDELTCALDLVRHIRARHGDYFGIAVAGYPEAHPSMIPPGALTVTSEGYESDLHYLKAKVEAGAELIVTQLFFDVELFLKFVKDCRRVGIKCPVVPGILPITTYRNFKFMTETCRTFVPAEVMEAVEANKADDKALAAYGVVQATEMCRRILDSGVRELHFYTMNREGPAVAVLRNLGLLGGGVMIPKAIEAVNEREAKKAIEAVNEREAKKAIEAVNEREAKERELKKEIEAAKEREVKKENKVIAVVN